MRTTAAIIVVILVVAAGVGVYVLSTQSSGAAGTELHLSITETDPVNQIDAIIPQNLTAKQGSVTLVVLNGDDENRTLTIAAFNFTMFIPPHQTVRSSFTADKTGTFVMFSPQTKPSAASNGKPGSPASGNLAVTA